MLVDTHCHIYLEEFSDDREETLQRAIKADIRKFVLPNVDNTSIGPMLELVASNPECCYPLMGLHPTSVDDNYKEDLKNVEKWLSLRKFYGIGEIGIDLYWDKTFIKEQIAVFRHQLQLAKNMHLPVVIHARDSFPEIFSVVEEEAGSNLTGIFHSFGGTLDHAKKIIDWGFKLGINGIVTFKNSELPEILKHISIENLVLETDAPYLAPVPHRGKRNEPAFMRMTCKKIAEIYGIPIPEVEAITTSNAQKVFNF
ncbi:MAG: TatD family hydrolase [Bacteroidota bacterium]|nr:TatD family hydrolase [Bacteroidota bacterium]MDP4206462.1 TatD family hydrolase [Bacteroidota bacterium]